MTTQTLLSTWIDGYESDPALAVTATLVAHPKFHAVLTLNGPDGQVELIGEDTIRSLMSQLEKQLGYIARRASREIEVAA